LANTPTATRNAFFTDLGSATEAARAGVVPDRAKAADSLWTVWCSFCHDLVIDPELQGIADPIPLLQVFAQRYRTGRLPNRHKQVRSRTVEDALRAVGQTMALMGTPDPRLNTVGKIDFRITRQLRSFKKADPPPNRVKPIPVPILHHAFAICLALNTARHSAIADMIWLAFYFLLRPGEYTAGTPGCHPFRLCDVELFIGIHKLDPLTCDLADLDAVTFAVLIFTTQKNCVRGEVIGHACSGSNTACPVRSTCRRVRALREANAPPDTPLCSYLVDDGSFNPLRSAEITWALRNACDTLGREYGFKSSDIEARSLRASGAMALLCAHVDTDLIRLIGRWRSDEMLRYLHLQAYPVMRGHAAAMLQGGDYRLIPDQTIEA